MISRHPLRRVGLIILLLFCCASYWAGTANAIVLEPMHIYTMRPLSETNPYLHKLQLTRIEQSDVHLEKKPSFSLHSLGDPRMHPTFELPTPSQNVNHSIFHVERVAGTEIQYNVWRSDSSTQNVTPVATYKTVSQIADAMKIHSGEEPISVSPTNFSEKELESFNRTLDIQAAGRSLHIKKSLPETPTDIEINAKNDALPETPNQRESPNYALLEIISTRPDGIYPMRNEHIEEEQSTDGTISFKQHADIAIATSLSIRLTVTSTVREWITYFMDQLRNYLAERRPNNWSLKDRVVAAKTDLKSKYHLTDDQVQSDFSVAVLGSELGENESNFPFNCIYRELRPCPGYMLTAQSQFAFQ